VKVAKVVRAPLFFKMMKIGGKEIKLAGKVATAAKTNWRKWQQSQ
jgi:hypothetical protein